MIWIIIAAVVVVGFAVWMGIENWRDDNPGSGIGAFFFTAMFGGLIAVVITMLINACAIHITGSHYEVESTSKLAALQDGHSSYGSFFLGSGSYNEAPAFFYYERHGKDVYTLEHAYAEYATVVETDDAPRVEYLEEKSDHPFWAIPVAPESFVTFYVPRGSVMSNYSLDAG